MNAIRNLFTLAIIVVTLVFYDGQCFKAQMKKDRKRAKRKSNGKAMDSR